MRVLHIYAGNLYGGVETLLVTLARYRELGAPMEPSFALCFPGRLRDELTATGAPVHDLGPTRFRLPWTIWMARSRLASLLRREDFAAVVCHTCWPHALFGPVVRRHRRPLIFWSHNPPSGGPWIERLARLTHPDLALANSRYTEAALLKLLPGVSTRLLFYPVAPPSIDRASARKEVRAELQTPQDAVVVVMAARLERWKGHTLLLESLARIADLPGWVCWIAGGAQRPKEQDYLNELTTLARRSGIGDRVQFLGQRSDVARLFAAADVHCQPNSEPEPFGIVFVEALYAGLPVVTVAHGGGLEIVDDTCGIRVPPGNTTGLTDSLRRVITDSAFRRRLGDNGPARAAALCSPAIQLRQLAQCIESCQRERKAV
jgi:glycosyltransferase involved in cell wall biosynthesis